MQRTKMEEKLVVVSKTGSLSKVEAMLKAGIDANGQNEVHVKQVGTGRRDHT